MVKEFTDIDNYFSATQRANHARDTLHEHDLKVDGYVTRSI